MGGARGVASSWEELGQGPAVGMNHVIGGRRVHVYFLKFILNTISL